MKKQHRELENSICYDVFNAAIIELNRDSKARNNAKRLRSCNAFVYETKNFYILQSYKTLIAAIRKSDNTCVNCMRGEYDFKANNCTGSTSTQQFYKFVYDYSPDRLTARICTYKAV